MIFKNLEKILSDYSNELQMLLKQESPKASGNLKNSISVSVKRFGTDYNVVCNIDEIYKYVEQGRKPGTFPPIDKLITWIKQKPVIPSPYKGKIPTTEQLAFLIGRSIKNKGIKPNKFFTNSIDKIHSKYEDKIIKAIQKDCDQYITNKLNKL